MTKFLKYHGRITGVGDLGRYEDLEALKKSSIIPDVDVEEMTYY